MKVPFENRIVLVGYDLALAGYTVHNKERLKNAVKNFQFSPDPAKLKDEYRKIFNAQPTGFGVIDATTMRVNPEDGFLPVHGFRAVRWAKTYMKRKLTSISRRKEDSSLSAGMRVITSL